MAQQTKYYPVYFAPDIDPSWQVNPGVLVDCLDGIPGLRDTLKTYRCSTSEAGAGFGTFSEATYGKPLFGEIVKTVGGSARVIVGTTTRLMELVTNWTDQSKGGTDYSTATDWGITTFGDDVIAVSKSNPPQVSSSTATAFVDLGGAPPKASCCTTQKNFVLLGDTNDGTDDLGDRVWWSALGNDASWTVSASTQAGNLRLRETPGKIRALVNMRDAVAVYKADALYILDYQGSPLLWTSRLVSDKVGCASINGVAVVNGIHYFLHRTGVHRFDGASVLNIGHGVNKFLFGKMGSQGNFETVQAVYDEYENCIFWLFHDSSANTNERRYALTYNVATGKFGFVQNVFLTTDGQCRSVIRATMGDIVAWTPGFGDTTNLIFIGYDNAAAKAQIRYPIYGSRLSNGTTDSRLIVTTGDIGDDDSVVTISRIKPRLLSTDTTTGSDATVYTKMYEGGSYDAGTTFGQDLTRQRYDGMRSARWLSATLRLHKAELSGLSLSLGKSGTE